jgi:opacity protein-like surface antigen
MSARFINKCLLATTCLVLLAGGARAADEAVPALKERVVFVSPFEVEVGARYWYSSGRYQKDLSGLPAFSGLNSRLTYDNLTASSAEAFWRVNHVPSGLFVKGYFGGGAVTGGHMNDEDFPPALVPYSNTLQQQKDGYLSYLSADLGWSFWEKPGAKIGVFMGYHYWNERLNTFGCTQIGANPGICASNPAFLTTPVPTTINGLDQDATWHSLRLGMNGEVMLAPALKLSGEANYVWSNLSASDFHNARQDIRPLPETGGGSGFQIEAILSYYLSPTFSVGVGGRWWHLTAHGFANFGESAAGGLSQVEDTTADRYGVFVQADYKFGDPLVSKTPAITKGPLPVAGYSWTGVYIGGNVGYGASNSTQLTEPLSPAADLLRGVTALKNLLPIHNAGFIGGGQVGVNWQFAPRWVAGLETDFDYAYISGTDAVSDFSDGAGTFIIQSGDQRIKSLGTVRARLGYLATPEVLVYATGGFAYGRTEVNAAASNDFQFVCNLPVGFGVLQPCAYGSSSGMSTGWTVGAGVELAATDRITFKGEYLYVDLGSRLATVIDGGNIAAFLGSPANYAVKADFNSQIVRVGVNYKLW